MRTAFLNFYDQFIANQSVFIQQWNRNTFPYRIVSGIFCIILIGLIIYLIVLIRRDMQASLEMLIDSIDAPDLPKKKIIEQWQGIIEKLETGDESSYKMAVMEADKILDSLLKRIGYKGNDMGERLKQITRSQVANIQEVWAAHKVRNRIAHEPDFYLTQADALRAVEAYERAFEDLELL